MSQKFIPQPFETMLSRFGSRLVLDLRPQCGQVRVSPVGPQAWREMSLALSVTVDGICRTFPFADGHRFARITQDISPTTVTLEGQDPDLPVRATARFLAPFVPRDAASSGTPALYLDITLTASRPAAGLLRAGLVAPGSRRLAGEGLTGTRWTADYAHAGACFTEELAFAGWSPEDQPGPAAAGQALEFRFSVTPGLPVTFRCILAACVRTPLLDLAGAPAPLICTEGFHDVEDVLRQALAERRAVEKVSRLFDSTLTASVLSPAAQHLASLGFQSYVANTWWVRQPDGQPWYSVWEGNCGYHSTLDVEYNQSVFYLWYWPELLEMLLRQWARFPRPGEGVMPHDMGSWWTVGGVQYGHAMPVEENTNHLLMLIAHWRWTGKDALIREQAGLMRELLDYLDRADTTGSGWPDQGTANTLDSGSRPAELSARQTTQAIRLLAVWEGAALAAREILQDAAWEQRARARQDLIRRTLETRAWQGDHYATCLDETVRGHNTWSMMTANGLLLPFLTGGWVPALDWERLGLDLDTATRATRRGAGCAMTAIDNTGWISQNLWRDAAAAYLERDLEYLAADYWAYEVDMNTGPRGNCFKDGWPPEVCQLNFYPRGLAAFALLPALAGLSFDRVAGTLAVRPLRRLRLHLPWAAVWEASKLPWIEAAPDGDRAGALLELMDAVRLIPRPDPPLAGAPAGAGPALRLLWGQGLVSGRHGSWGEDEVLGLRSFEVTAWWEGPDATAAGSFSLDLPPHWRCLPLDSPVREDLAPGRPASCRFAVLASADHDWTRPHLIRARFEREDGQVHEAVLQVTGDPERD